MYKVAEVRWNSYVHAGRKHDATAIEEPDAETYPADEQSIGEELERPARENHASVVGTLHKSHLHICRVLGDRAIVRRRFDLDERGTLSPA